MFAVVAAVVEILFFYGSLTSWLNDAPDLWSVEIYNSISANRGKKVKVKKSGLVKVIFNSILGNTKPQ